MNIFAMVRRFFMILILVFLNDYPYFQIVFLVIMSLLNLIYLVTVFPYLDSKINYTDIIGEIAVYINIWTSILYQMHMPTKVIVVNVGWMQITLTSIIIAIGVISTTLDIPRNIRFSYRKMLQAIG